MKTIVTLSLTCLFALATAQFEAQDLATQSPSKGKKTEVKHVKKPPKKLFGEVVSTRSKDNFVVDFGNLPDVLWRRSSLFDEATFLKDGKNMTAYYDFESKLVGTTTHVSFSELPLKGQNELKSRYKDYKIEEVILFDDNEINETDMVLWENPFEDVDNYFVVLTKEQEKLIVRVDTEGYVYYFKKL